MTSPHPIFGNAPTKLHFCPNCVHTLSLGQINHPIGQHPAYPWATELICPLCNCIYTICIQCRQSRTHFTTRRMVQRHHRLNHTQREKAHRHHPFPPRHVNAQSSGSISDLPTDSSSATTTQHPTPLTFLETIARPQPIFSTKSSTMYFQHQIKDGSGPIYL
jgi:hypothetical protein